MIAPPIPVNEEARLNALNEYSILDSLPESEYNDITRLASQICNTPISLISLIDSKRQWFKSKVGIDVIETPRNISFCAHAIVDNKEIFVVEDSRKDKRFIDNPLVNGDPHVVFYAGLPLINSDGFPLGTLCVIDNKPNKLNSFQISALEALSNQLMKLFELRKKTIELDKKNIEINRHNESLENFARIAAHDMKSPLANIVMLTDILKGNYQQILDEEGNSIVHMIHESSGSLIQLIDGVLNYSRNSNLLTEVKETFELTDLLRTTSTMVNPMEKAKITINCDGPIKVTTNRVAIEQVIINLLTNAIKYNDKKDITIELKVEEESDCIRIHCIDNGPGIPETDRIRIFKLFETLHHTSNQTPNKGLGIGLATVLFLIEGLGGTIFLHSTIGSGSDFEFTIRK